MLGAIAGDVVGSVYQASPVKTADFGLFMPGSRFTDDMALTVATAGALLGGGDYAGAYRRYGRAYPSAGCGGSFYRWLLTDDAGPYNRAEVLHSRAGASSSGRTIQANTHCPSASFSRQAMLPG